MLKQRISRADLGLERSSRMRNAHGPATRSWWLLPAAVLAVSLAACDYHDDDDDCCYSPDWKKPAAPQGLYSITRDGRVDLRWVANTENDLAGYRIYRNDSARGYYERIGSVGRYTTQFTDGAVWNGRTYYYAVAAIDEDGNESDLSEELVYDTPRPEGFGLVLENALEDPAHAGYDFSNYEVVDARDLDADVYFWSDPEAGPWVIATERSETSFTDIQDAGFVPLDEVDWAPDGGWSPSGDVPLIEGHAYVVWTWDDHFAKFRVRELSSERVVVDWAYQVDEGNPELSVPGPATERSPQGRVHRAGLDRR